MANADSSDMAILPMAIVRADTRLTSIILETGWPRRRTQSITATLAAMATPVAQ